MLKSPHSTDWIAYFLLLDVALIAILRHYFPGRFFAFFKVPISSAYFTEFAQEKEQPFWFGLILEIIMIISISLFIYLLINLGNGQNPVYTDYILFAKIAMIALLFLTSQRLFHSVTGILFNMPKSLNLWMHVKDAYLRWAAILLALVVLLATFSVIPTQPILLFGLIVLALAYIIGVFKGSSLLAGNKTLNGSHIIFYLCTLEILPVIVLVKLII